MDNKKPKEEVKTENNDRINLKVAGQDGSVVQFKIKRHTPLGKLTKDYCERQGFLHFLICQRGGRRRREEEEEGGRRGGGRGGRGGGR
uniref:Rad60/SUMO-like domain-containing protein n=1 Tax=Aotus nancymaae TaxID=37293 RepID=A0A2K5CSJ0_AOTNA